MNKNQLNNKINIFFVPELWTSKDFIPLDGAMGSLWWWVSATKANPHKICEKVANYLHCVSKKVVLLPYCVVSESPPSVEFPLMLQS